MPRPLQLVLALLSALLLPGPLLQGGADSWVDPRSDAALDLARALDAQLARPLEAADYGTGAALFDGEWWLATHAFALVGYAQVARTHPEALPELREAARRSLDELLRPEVRAFDTRLWGDDMLACLHDDAHDHVVLGYLGLGLGAARLLDPELPEAGLHDRVAAALDRRLSGRHVALLATYPGQGFPVDNAAAFGALGLHARATGQQISPGVRGALARWESRYVSPDGLLHQTADPRTGRPTSPPRGSGTTLAAVLLAPADARLARRLATGVRRHLHREVLGMGGVREHRTSEEAPWGHLPLGGDVDSGPVLLGVSVSATGFGLGAMRVLGDEEAFASLWATTRLFGLPWPGEGFLAGGPLGNALMLALLTTPTAPLEAS